MKTKIYILTVILFILTFFHFHLIAQPCANPANIYSFNYNGKTYELVKEAKTWVEAAACAVSKGGYLIQINDAAEQTAVYNAITSSGVAVNYSPVNDGGGTSYIWIGATDKNNEGTWIWDGNNDNSGTNFWTGQGAAGSNNGATVGGSFVNWGGKSAGTIQEPDDFASNQDGGAIALTGWPYGTTMLGKPGEWNDISITNSIYYIIEYDQPSGMGNNQNINFSLTVFPVPVVNTLEIPNSDQLYKVKIISLLGELIYSLEYKNINHIVIDVSGLLPGSYFVLAEGKNNQFYNTKIIKL